MARASSQKFIGRNRAPRVQIEYDVETYGSDKKVQLPFVVGVLSDLSGKSLVEQPALADRKMMEIDIDNFDARLKALLPRATFRVKNTLTGVGDLSVDLTFESMDDFSPAAVARKVDSLSHLLEARSRLSKLLAYMDGKTGAEDLVQTLLSSRDLLEGLGHHGDIIGAHAVAAEKEDIDEEIAAAGDQDAGRAQTHAATAGVTAVDGHLDQTSREKGE